MRTVAGLIAAIYIGLQWGPFVSWGGPVMAFFAVFATPVIVCFIAARLVFLLGPLASIIGTVSLALHMYHEYRRVTVNPIADPWRWVNSAEVFPLYHFGLVLSTVVAVVVAYGFYRMRRGRRR